MAPRPVIPLCFRDEGHLPGLGDEETLGIGGADSAEWTARNTPSTSAAHIHGVDELNEHDFLALVFANGDEQGLEFICN